MLEQGEEEEKEKEKVKVNEKETENEKDQVKVKEKETEKEQDRGMERENEKNRGNEKEKENTWQEMRRRQEGAKRRPNRRGARGDGGQARGTAFMGGPAMETSNQKILKYKPLTTLQRFYFCIYFGCFSWWASTALQLQLAPHRKQLFVEIICLVELEQGKTAAIS